MGLIGMPQAAERLGLSSRSTKRALRAAGITLHEINARALAVDESDLENFIAQRQGYVGRGRPIGAKNRSKENEEQTQSNDKDLNA